MSQTINNEKQTEVEGSAVEDLRLAPGVRVLVGEEAVRIRAGIWNFDEASLELGSLPEDVVGAVLQLFRGLQDGGEVNLDRLFEEEQLGPAGQATVRQLCAELTEGRLIQNKSDAESGQRALTALMGQSIGADGDYPQPQAEHVHAEGDCGDAGCAASTAPPRVLFLGGSGDLRDRARLPVAGFGELIVDDGTIADALRAVDLVTSLDGLASEDAYRALDQHLNGVDLIVSVGGTVDLRSMQNLGRYAVRAEVGLILAFTDGPFASVMSLRSPRTGCFECFCLRSLARLEDHVAYVDFQRQSAPRTDNPSSLDDFLLSLAMMEASLVMGRGVSRFYGRSLNIYLPTFEIQVQNVLRMPGCPACGQVAQQRLEEIAFNTRRAVDLVLKPILEQ